MKTNNNPSTGKQILLHVVSFFLAITIVLILAITSAGLTLFNDRDILSKVSGTNYFSQLNEDITIKCKTIAAKYGVEYKIIAEVITPSKIDADMTVYFNSMKIQNPYDAGKTINTENLKKQLIKKFEENNAFTTDSQKNLINVIAGMIADEYKAAIVVEGFETYLVFAREYKAICRYVLLGSLVVFAYLFCVIFVLNGKTQKHKLLRRYAISFGSAGLTILCVSVIVKFTEVIERISFVEVEREYKLFVYMFTEYIKTFSIAGLFCVMTAVVLLALWYMSVTGRTKRFI